jgi:predicted membrane protein
MAELSDRYEHNLGTADLDLSQLNFDGQDKRVIAEVGAGDLHVTVPRYVDVVVHAKVNVGNSNVFNSTWDGVNNPSRTITDNDTDGPGHGHLTLDLRVNAGTLEVSR